jgi:hypothetical protein
VWLRWRASIHGVTCLLIDGVLTTGEPLREAARALRAPTRTTSPPQRLQRPNDAAYRLREMPSTQIQRRSPVDGHDPLVFLFGVSRRAFVVYRSSMSPRVAVSTAESGAGTVGRWAPRGSLGSSPRRGWCGG